MKEGEPREPHAEIVRGEWFQLPGELSRFEQVSNDTFRMATTKVNIADLGDFDVGSFWLQPYLEQKSRIIPYECPVAVDVLGNVEWQYSHLLADWQREHESRLYELYFYSIEDDLKGKHVDWTLGVKFSNGYLVECGFRSDPGIPPYVGSYRVPFRSEETGVQAIYSIDPLFQGFKFSVY